MLPKRIAIFGSAKGIIHLILQSQQHTVPETVPQKFSKRTTCHHVITITYFLRTHLYYSYAEMSKFIGRGGDGLVKLEIVPQIYYTYINKYEVRENTCFAQKESMFGLKLLTFKKPLIRFTECLYGSN